MEKRKTFLQSVSKEFVEDFLQFVQLDRDVFDPFNLNELLEELPRKQKEELWERLKNLLTDVLLETPVDEWQRHEKECDDHMEIENGPDKKQTFKVIYAVTYVITISLSVINQDENYNALLECAIILNSIIYALPESESNLQNSIHQLCMIWWEKGLEAKEDMGKTAFMILLKKSLNTKTGADVCRLWNIHPALLCFDYDLEESDEIKDMLLQCFMNINGIKTEKGRRFLSFLFSWNINFIRVIHETIKDQLHILQKISDGSYC